MGCGNCKYFDDQLEECHINPPVAVYSGKEDTLGRLDVKTIWPEVSSDDWCGKWEEYEPIQEH